MKPVLIQHLIKNAKGKYKATPTSKEEHENYGNKFNTFILCFFAVIVLVGILLG